MLDIVENDDAELRVLEQVRGLGRELLQGWAEEGAEKVERAWDNRQDFRMKTFPLCLSFLVRRQHFVNFRSEFMGGIANEAGLSNFAEQALKALHTVARFL